MAPRKRKAPKKIAPPKDAKETVIHTDPFHITFPITLIYKEANLTKFCYFQVKEHLDKYINRFKLKPKDYKVEETKSRINGEQ